VEPALIEHRDRAAPGASVSAPGHPTVAVINRTFTPEMRAAPKPLEEAPTEHRPPSTPAPSTSGEEPLSGTATASSDEQAWIDAVNFVRSSSPRLGASLAFGRLISLGTSELTLAFSRQSAFHRGIVGGSGRGQIEQMLSAHFGRAVRLRIEDASANSAAPLSPAELEAQQKDARDRELAARVRANPAVQAALRVLGGEIEQMQPLDSQRAAPLLDTSDETS
jgi:hypothetical protein